MSQKKTNKVLTSGKDIKAQQFTVRRPYLPALLSSQCRPGMNPLMRQRNSACRCSGWCCVTTAHEDSALLLTDTWTLGCPAS